MGRTVTEVPDLEYTTRYKKQKYTYQKSNEKCSFTQLRASTAVPRRAGEASFDFIQSEQNFTTKVVVFSTKHKILKNPLTLFSLSCIIISESRKEIINMTKDYWEMHEQEYFDIMDYINYMYDMLTDPWKEEE